ncbi:MAG: SH3 domain-containing protein [Bacillaceae bacterium]|nr:SH3 domain-containing protein [Bacillaceae bacterium]
MSKYTVIKDHKSNYPDPIILKKDQEVLYGEEDTQYPNWIFCKSNSTKKEGWVPKQILTNPNPDGIAIVTKDYSAHELTIKKGDTVLGLEHLNDWTYCKTENKELGWIPTSCLAKS